MAHLNHCIYCSGIVINRAWHPECRMAFCENLLSQIKKCVLKKPKLALPKRLIEILLKDRFETTAEHNKRVWKMHQTKIKQELRQLALNAATSNFISEWEKNNPNPDPVTY